MLLPLLMPPPRHSDHSASLSHSRQQQAPRPPCPPPPCHAHRRHAYCHQSRQCPPPPPSSYLPAASYRPFPRRDHQHKPHHGRTDSSPWSTATASSPRSLRRIPASRPTYPAPPRSGHFSTPTCARHPLNTRHSTYLRPATIAPVYLPPPQIPMHRSPHVPSPHGTAVTPMYPPPPMSLAGCGDPTRSPSPPPFPPQTPAIGPVATAQLGADGGRAPKRADRVPSGRMAQPQASEPSGSGSPEQRTLGPKCPVY